MILQMILQTPHFSDVFDMYEQKKEKAKIKHDAALFFPRLRSLTWSHGEIKECIKTHPNILYSK